MPHTQRDGRDVEHVDGDVRGVSVRCEVVLDATEPEWLEVLERDDLYAWRRLREWWEGELDVGPGVGGPSCCCGDRRVCGAVRERVRGEGLWEIEGVIAVSERLYMRAAGRGEELSGGGKKGVLQVLWTSVFEIDRY